MSHRLKIALLTVAAFAVLFIVLTRNSRERRGAELPEQPAGQTATESFPARQDGDVEVIAANLDIPWEIVFLPESPPGEQGVDILVTERPGTLLIIRNKQKIPVEGVEQRGEGGLLGMALHPDFASNHFIYLYLTARAGGRLTNRVERYRLEDARLSDRRVILEGIVGAPNHDGGRIAFGPDGFLYVTTGDAERPDTAQDTSSLNGKILRVAGDGSVPPDNPFGNAVYSYGHRNSQGLAWDGEGRLWATEHGPQARDEVNRIEKGANYGWPVIQGDEQREGMESPVIQSGPDVTWAPAGAAYSDGRIFFGGLRGEALFEYNIADKSIKKHFEGRFGRIRAVILGPDDFLYLTTSNTDGRGNPRPGDDKLIRIEL